MSAGCSIGWNASNLSRITAGNRARGFRDGLYGRRRRGRNGIFAGDHHIAMVPHQRSPRERPVAVHVGNAGSLWNPIHCEGTQLLEITALHKKCRNGRD
jgi:hypothetical protein